MGARDVGLLLLRVGVGASCFAHGSQKLFGWFGGAGLEGTGQFFESVGFTPGRLNAQLAGLCEAGGGALMALGLASGPAGAALAGNMTVASSVHYPKFFVTEGGLEMPATYGLVGAALAVGGPGRYSLDAVTPQVLNRPRMGAVALVSAAAASALIIRQRASVLAKRAVPPEEVQAGATGAAGGGDEGP